eukprot:scaffold437_cov288-Chaetoceros_neogracile.AAC.21
MNNKLTVLACTFKVTTAKHESQMDIKNVKAGLTSLRRSTTVELRVMCQWDSGTMNPLYLAYLFLSILNGREEVPKPRECVCTQVIFKTYKPDKDDTWAIDPITNDGILV